MRTQNRFVECLPFRVWFANSEWFYVERVVKVTKDDVSFEVVSRYRGTRAISFEHRRPVCALIYGHGHLVICLQDKVQLSRCQLALSWWRRSGSATAFLGAHHCHYFFSARYLTSTGMIFHLISRRIN